MTERPKSKGKKKSPKRSRSPSPKKEVPMPINPVFDMDQKVLWFSDALYLGEYIHS